MLEIDFVAYQPLVNKVVRINTPAGVDRADAISIANLALLRASELFDPTLHPNCKFDTYAISAMKYELWKLVPERNESFDEALHSNHVSNLTTTLPEEEKYTPELRALVLSKISLLLPREQEIIRQYFGIDCEEKSQREIAVSLNICNQRVSQLYERALYKLKRALTNSFESPEQLDRRSLRSRSISNSNSNLQEQNNA